jgi:hypothetical protein
VPELLLRVQNCDLVLIRFTFFNTRNGSSSWFPVTVTFWLDWSQITPATSAAYAAAIGPEVEQHTSEEL